MIVQITITRNELFLLKEMMPHWQKYSDGFVFMLDRCDDGTIEFLTENKEKFNILSILDSGVDENNLKSQIESDFRQKLYDEALKFSNKIICLDTDEYIDGTLNKNELEQILDNHPDTLFHARWIQYTDKDTIRTDGPWKMNFKDRIASYSERCTFKNAQMHSEHLPVPKNQVIFNFPSIFIAHLQWLDKKTVAVKQYYWKIVDYTVKNKFNINTTEPSAYDNSVNNFNWTYEKIQFPLKIDPKIYSYQDINNSFKYKFIKQKIKEFKIPNLNDWGMNIHE